MIKTLYIKSLLSTLLFLLLVGQLFCQDISEKEAMKFNQIPTNAVVDMKHKKIAFNKLFVSNQATVLMFFSPDCDHCEHELEKIQNSNEKLSSINFILLSNRPIELIQAFAQKHQLHKYSNIQVYADPENFMARYYGIGGYPSMLIYTQQHVASKKYVSMIINDVAILRAAYPLKINYCTDEDVNFNNCTTSSSVKNRHSPFFSLPVLMFIMRVRFNFLTS